MIWTSLARVERRQHLYNMQIFDGTALSWYTPKTLFSGWEQSPRQFSTTAQSPRVTYVILHRDFPPLKKTGHTEGEIWFVHGCEQFLPALA